MITYLYNSKIENHHVTLSEMMGHKNKSTTNLYINFEALLNGRDSSFRTLAIKPNSFKKPLKKQ
jgi:uncharacterized protein (DUF39 family)